MSMPNEYISGAKCQINEFMSTFCTFSFELGHVVWSFFNIVFKLAIKTQIILFISSFAVCLFLKLYPFGKLFSNYL
jgi:hypothetical protein